METKNYIFIAVFALAMAAIVYSSIRLIKYLRLAQKDNRTDKIGERIKNVFVIAFGQVKLFRDPGGGIPHSLIFWGFILFLFAVIEAVVQGFYSPFTLEFLGPFYAVITFTQDAFGLLVIAAVITALIRRFVIKVERLEVDKTGKADAAVILLLILVVVVSMFGQNMSMVAARGYFTAEYEFRPVSVFLAKAFFGSGASETFDLYNIFWWVHIGSVLFFLNYLPYSKHLHVLTSIPNVFFAKTKDKAHALKPLDLEDEELEFFGADDFDKLTWKQILDGYSCTECGRCTANCPANLSEKTLSPRKIITDIRERTFEKAPLMSKGLEEHELLDKTLVHNHIEDKELWQCTTCSACEQECPVMIEHIDSIVEMRRHLVLMESQFPQELNNVFKNLETNFTPWAFNQNDRANWAEGLDIKTMKEDPEGEILFWVGCAGSFDDRYKKASRAFAQIMQKAGVDFRILGTEEKCNGDTARRLGNEYLAQELMKMNVETLNNYKVKKIVTACPHCFNSFKKEYPQFGGNFEVVHHTEFIAELLKNGKIEIDKNEETKNITYHDSCYLGRYNNIYSEPREVVKKLTNGTFTELDRNKSRGFCCGAGGGRLFLEDVEGGRVNINRIEEALNKNIEQIATACPFCMTMLEDGLKSKNKNEEVSVQDISELVLNNLK